MKDDEELFKAWKSEQSKDLSTEERFEFVEHLLSFPKYFEKTFLAGLKAGRPQWHDLEKEPTDLPKDNHNVWCKALDHYGEGWYDKDTNTWTLIYRGYHLHCIEAWCEIPTFDKE